MDKRSVTIKDQSVKKKIAEDIIKSQSSLIGCFFKPKVPGIVINHWQVASVSNPVFLRFVAKEMTKIIKKIGGVDLICGVETAGIGIATAISLVSGIPWVYARKDKKTYGSMEAFEGTYKRGMKVVFIDNFTARGNGMPHILKNAEEQGFIFHDQISIIDNCWKKIDEYEKYDVTVHSLVTAEELNNELNKLGYFPGKLYDFIKIYVENPFAWTTDSDIVKEFIKEINKAPDLPYIKKESCLNLNKI